jgi:hypothetical protein
MTARLPLPTHRFLNRPLCVFNFTKFTKNTEEVDG